MVLFPDLIPWKSSQRAFVPLESVQWRRRERHPSGYSRGYFQSGEVARCCPTSLLRWMVRRSNMAVAPNGRLWRRYTSQALHRPRTYQPCVLLFLFTMISPWMRTCSGGMCNSKDPELIKEVVEYTKKPLRTQDFDSFWITLANNPFARRILIDYTYENFDAVSSGLFTGSTACLLLTRSRSRSGLEGGSIPWKISSRYVTKPPRIESVSKRVIHRIEHIWKVDNRRRRDWAGEFLEGGYCSAPFSISPLITGLVE